MVLSNSCKQGILQPVLKEISNFCSQNFNQQFQLEIQQNSRNCSFYFYKLTKNLSNQKQPEALTIKVGKLVTGSPILAALLRKHNVCTESSYVRPCPNRTPLLIRFTRRTFYGYKFYLSNFLVRNGCPLPSTSLL